jgi:hypothetical protein
MQVAAVVLRNRVLGALVVQVVVVQAKYPVRVMQE